MAHSGFTPYSYRDFIKQLRQLLQDRYTWDGDGFSILKELIQNANDAGATQLDLGWVPAAGECDAHPLLGGAAFFAVNDGLFQPSDARNITRLGSNSKAGEAIAAGRFGLGLKSVFHLCEAFFYLASSPQPGQERICRIFNPWSPQPGDESSPYEHWDFEPGDPRAKQLETFIRERLGGVLHGSSRYFCLWIPLRNSRLLPDKPSIVPGDFNERRLQTMIGHDALGCRLAELLPFLHSLQTIRIWSPQSRELVEQLRVQLGNDSLALPKLPELEGDRYPQSRHSNLSGHVVLSLSQHSEVRCDFVGRETVAQSASLEKLWNHENWPEDESLDPETNCWREHRTKLVPHGAVRFMAVPATGRSGRLSMHWCVFLPNRRRIAPRNNPSRRQRHRATVCSLLLPLGIHMKQAETAVLSGSAARAWGRVLANIYEKQRAAKSSSPNKSSSAKPDVKAAAGRSEATAEEPKTPHGLKGLNVPT